tara:strand:+ start:5289 stop:5936 length:648 start_codon:yes stop_codon:yes gene_type:complete
MEERFENKFIFSRGDEKNFRSLITNGFLRKLYENRVVNSIYYDTITLDNLYHNINGSNNRVKYRVRWYNQINNSEVFFEKKIKSGLITKKKKISLGFFSSHFLLRKYLKSENFLKKINTYTTQNLIEVLAVSYERAYFGDFEKKLRVTFDTKIKTQKRNMDTFFEIDSDILELKYDLTESNFVKNKIKKTNFNLRNQKFSKYVRSFLLLSEMGFH